MKRLRFVLLGLLVTCVLSIVLYPLIGASGARTEVEAEPVFTLSFFASPNVVVDGDTVTYTIRVENVGYVRGDVTVTDSIGEANQGYVSGVKGGAVSLMGGTQKTIGIEPRYVTGSIDSMEGTTLRNISPQQVVLIQYTVSVDDRTMDPTQFSPVRSTVALSTGQNAMIAIRILGSNVTDRDAACSNPAFGTFPDPSSRAELQCFVNYLTDTGRVSDPAQSREVAPILAQELKTCSYSASRTYTDVSKDNAFQCSISTATDMEIVQGYADGTFRPARLMTRAEFAKVVLNAASLPVSAASKGTSRFRDVPESFPLKDTINAAAEYGIVSGYQDGTFRPHASIRRDEAMKMILRAFKLPTIQEFPAPPEIVVVSFSDVKPTDPLSAYVITAGTLGIVDGYKGNFYPSRSVTRGEVTKMVAKTIGYLTEK